MAGGSRRAPGPRRPRPGTAALRPPPRLREPCPGTPYLAPPWPSWPGTARRRKGRGGCRGLGQESSAVLQQSGKEGKELSGGSAALALTELCEWGRQAPVAKGPRDPPAARCSTPWVAGGATVRALRRGEDLRFSLWWSRWLP